MTEPSIQCTADKCGASLPEGIHLCYNHLTDLGDDLDAIPGILSDLGAVAIRDTKYGDGLTNAAGETPLLADFEAITKGRELAALVHSWTTLIQEQTDDKPRDPRSPASCARWVRSKTRTIRSSDWAGDMADELRVAVRQNRAATDRPEPRVFAGMCPTSIQDQTCGAPLYTLSGTPTAHCRVCGNNWDATTWRAEAIEAAAMHTGTAVEVSRILSDPVTLQLLPQSKIWDWVRRGLLAPINREEIAAATLEGRRLKPVYQIRKVRNLWVRMQASKYGNPRHKTPCNTPTLAA